jgi:hypothetical protein
MKRLFVVFIALISVLSGVVGCSSSKTETTTATNTASGITGTKDNCVEITYFYESDACFCLNLASQWIDTIMNDYEKYLADGTITFAKYDTTDSANSAIQAAYDSPAYSFYITTWKDGVSNRKAVNTIWMYTDTTGKNEVLKQKFFNTLHREIDNALNAI